MSDTPPFDPSVYKDGKPPSNIPRPEERERMVEDATKALRDKYPDRPPDDIQRVVEKAKAIHRSIIATMKGVHDAAVAAGQPTGPEQMTPLALKLYLARFNEEFSYEELLYLNAMWHTELLCGVVQREAM